MKKAVGIDFPDNNHSCDCSEAQSTILRESGLVMYPTVQVNEISPLMAFRWVMSHGGKDVTDKMKAHSFRSGMDSVFI